MRRFFKHLKELFQRLFCFDEEELVRRFFESRSSCRLTPEEKEHLYAILEGREE